MVITLRRRHVAKTRDACRALNMKIAENQPCDRNRSNLYFADVNLLNARLGDRRFRQGCSHTFFVVSTRSLQRINV